MKWQVYWQTSFTKVWKFCGGFETFTSANEHIDYLSAQIPGGTKRKFKIDGMLKSFNVSDFGRTTT